MEEPVSLSETGEIDKLTPSETPQVFANPELVVLTVEIGDGRRDAISIRELDDPDTLARLFAEKHALDLSLQENLASLIRQNKELAELQSVSSPEGYRWSDFMTSQTSPHPRGTLFEFASPQTCKQTTNQTEPAPKKITVHERLYSHALQRQKARSAAPPPPAPKRTTSINYGEWLYIKGIKMKEAQTANIQAKRKAREAELDKLSFRPVINQHLVSPRYFQRTEELLLRKSLSYKENLQKAKTALRKQEIAACPFTPTILHRSSKSATGQRFQQLFKEAEERDYRRQRRADAAQPSSVHRVVTLTEQKEFAHRLIAQRNQFEAQMEDTRQQYQLPTFQPIVGRGPQEPRHEADISIHEYLYSKRNVRRERVLALDQQQQQHWRQQAQSLRPLSQSSQLAQKLKMRQYARLFSMLDADHDGVINAHSVVISGIDLRMRKILTPVFTKLDSGQELQIDAFVSILEDAWPTLSSDEKAHFLRRQPSSSLSAKPFAENVQFTESCQRIVLPGDLYERMMQKQRLLELKRDKQRELKQEAEIQPYSFRPAILRYRKSQF